MSAQQVAAEPSDGALGALSRRARAPSTLNLFDSAISSSSNFLLSVIVASRVSVEDFGRYGAAFALYAIAYGVWRAFGAEPFLLSRSKSSQEVVASLSASVWVGGLFAVGGLVASLFVDGTTERTIVAFAIGLPILAAHDGVRYALIGTGKPGHALFVDLMWLVLMPLLILVDGGAATMVLFWCAASIPSLVVGLALLGWPAFRNGRDWIRSHWEVASRFTLEFWITNGSLILILFAVGWSSGLVEMGNYRGAAVLVGPVTVVTSGLMTTTLLLDISMLGRETLLIRVRTLALAGAATGLLTAGAIAATPAFVGEVLLGDTWSGSRTVGVPLSVAMGSLSVLIVVATTFRVLGQQRLGYRYRVGGIAALTFAGLLGSLHSAQAAALGMAAIATVAGALSLRALGRQPALSVSGPEI